MNWACGHDGADQKYFKKSLRRDNRKTENGIITSGILKDDSEGHIWIRMTQQRVQKQAME
jgi:hypothetical protein